MHVTQPLLEPHHRLAVGGETEMAGLDDAGMDRADRDLVQALALDRQELVALFFFAPRPTAMVQPRSGVRQADRIGAVEIAHGALQPQRRRVMAADRGVGVGRFGLDRGHGAKAALAVVESHVHEIAVGPQGGQIVQARRAPCSQCLPGRGINAKPHISVRAGGAALDEVGKGNR